MNQRLRRVVSLLPSATEMVCVAGGRQQLVGVSHECDFPAGLEDIPRLTVARPLTGGSRRIHESLADFLKQALSIYQLDVPQLVACRPNLVVTQDLCDVCAVSYSDVQRALQEHLPGCELLNLHPLHWDDVWDDLRRVGQALGDTEQVSRFLQRRDQLAEQLREGCIVGLSPRVCTIEWIDPVILGGTWMPEMIELAGGIPEGSRAGEKAPTQNREFLESLQPDVILIKPCGYSLEQALNERQQLPKVLPWNDWPAVARGQVYVADGSAYFNRPGPRLLESLEILAACIQPLQWPQWRSKHAGSVRRLAADLTPFAFDA